MARPIITRSQPVCLYISRQLSRLSTSPFPITGTETLSLTFFIISQSAFPEYIWSLVLPWTATASAPACSIATANSTALTESLFQPFRNFTVTGTPETLFTAFTISAARSISFIKALPELLFTTFGTGHPMLISSMSGAYDMHISVAFFINSGSSPKSCKAIGRSPSVTVQSSAVFLSL